MEGGRGGEEGEGGGGRERGCKREGGGERESSSCAVVSRWLVFNSAVRGPWSCVCAGGVVCVLVELCGCPPL